MIIEILENQLVISNMNYMTCESGEFHYLDFVKCKRIDEGELGTCMFLAISIIEENQGD